MVTLPALTVNAADVAPCTTVTVCGIPAAVGFALVNDTMAPPAAAGPVRVTKPEAD